MCGFGKVDLSSRTAFWRNCLAKNFQVKTENVKFRIQHWIFLVNVSLNEVSDCNMNFFVNIWKPFGSMFVRTHHDFESISTCSCNMHECHGLKSVVKGSSIENKCLPTGLLVSGSPLWFQIDGYKLQNVDYTTTQFMNIVKTWSKTKVYLRAVTSYKKQS